MYYPEKIVSQSYNKRQERPYMQVWIGNPTTGREKCYVHRLVAEAFVDKPNTDDKLEVNHEDGDKKNNRADNLTWMTRKQNMQHASVNGLINRTSEKRKRQCAINGATGARLSYIKLVKYDKEGNFIEIIKNSVGLSGAKRSLQRYGDVYRDYKNLMERFGEIPNKLHLDTKVVTNRRVSEVRKLEQGRVVEVYPNIASAPLNREKIIDCYNHRTLDEDGYMWDIL